MKIVGIGHGRRKIRVVPGDDYDIDGIRIIAQKGIPHNIEYHQDYPDIDIDFLPIAREHIKRYAAEKYGHDKVCSVGLWQRYKPKLALVDTCRTMGIDILDIQKITKTLPDEFDDMDYDQAANTFPEFRVWADGNEGVVKLAYRLVKLIKAQGRHAGGLIISKVPVRDHIPLTLSGKQEEKNWTSAWTEGKSTQLSKFGFVKFDILGLTNLLHIWNCKKLIKENRGVTIDWSDINQEENRIGWEILPDGSKHPITFDDRPALLTAHQRKVDTIFQFDTDLAKSILQKSGIKSFNDLVVLTALGRPGPLALCPEYIARRDGHTKWKDAEDPRIVEILKDTEGIICFDSETMISTVEGNDIQIKDLKIGQKVWSFNRKTQAIEEKVVEKVGYTRTEEGLTIQTDDNRSITTTRDHKFLCWGDVEKRADQLKIGDLVPIPNIGLVNETIRYQKIKSIQPSGIREFYGLSVADNHTVIANGIIIKQCFQEQLSNFMIKICGFTVPEAEAARKAVAKKWADQLAKLKDKVVDGATRTIGADKAIEWWGKIESFARYCFNKCLGKDTMLTDVITQEQHSVEEWSKLGRYPSLKSYVDGQIVIDKCINIHENDEMDVYEVEFDNGQKEHVTLDHRFLCVDGSYHNVEEILSKGLEIANLMSDRHNKATKI